MNRIFTSSTQTTNPINFGSFKGFDANNELTSNSIKMESNNFSIENELSSFLKKACATKLQFLLLAFLLFSSSVGFSQISSSTPADDANNANLDSDIVINFDYNIVAGSGNISIKYLSDDSDFEIIPIGDTKVSITDNVLTINPAGTLSPGVEYYIEIDATAIDDESGNSFAGITDNSTLNFSGVQVVINEIVTDPQTDWSTDGFVGTDGGSTITYTDEWLELLIKSDGIDFTGWTIELLDGTDVTGDLTSTGAFDKSVYSSIDGGTWSSTKNGDYLVLGNVDGTGAMNNSITIQLKDFSGAVVDAVTLGGGDGEAPSGNATSIYNESVQRFTNGLDADTDDSDFTMGVASLGAANSGPSVSLSSSSTTLTEDGGESTITATLSAASSQTTTINLSIAGTATGTGNDYSISSSTIIIIAGETTGTTTITSIHDTKFEADETIIVDISSVTNGTEEDTQQETITITDDDNAAVTIADISGNENDGAITVTATLDYAVQGGFTVDVSTADGTATTADSDYSSVISQTLAFAGTEGETQTFTIIPTGDTKLEADEAVTISQSNLAATTLSVVITDGATITIANDDISTVTIADVSGNENDGAITVTATLDYAVQGGFTVDVSTVDGTSTTADSDYGAITSQTLTFAGTQGETQTFSFTPTADTKLEADETLTISQSNLAATALSVVITDEATITITNDDNAAVSIADNSGNEDDGAITVTATLDYAVQGGFTVDVSTKNYTATTEDADYSAVVGQTLTFTGTANETQTFTITPTSDTKLERNEMAAIGLGNLAATTLGVVISDSAAVTIINDDISTVTIADISGNEDDGAIIVTATLDFAVQGGFSVDVSSSDGTATTANSDYGAIVSQSLTFAGTANETQTFTITPTSDTQLEADETITISQSNLAATTLDVVITDEATVTITNDDISTVTIADVSGNENDGAITLTATLDNIVDGGFTVDISTINGTATSEDSDFTALVNHTLTFAGTSGETQSFTITPTADTKLEANEILTVTQSNLSATSLPVEISDGATITINNDDNAAVSIADNSGNEDDGAITVTATLDYAVQGGFTVDVSTKNYTATTEDADYSAVVGQTLTFTGTANETQTFTITPTSDTKLERNEMAAIGLGNLAATTLGVVINDSATVTIINDDISTVTIADISGNEDDGAIIVTATLDFAVQGGFSVDVSSSDGTATTANSDYGAIVSQSLTFAGTANETQTFTITPTSDTQLEVDETITISQSNLAATTLGVVITDGATVTITNDDISTVTIADVSGNEDDGAITLTATLDNVVDGGFTVDISTVNGTATSEDSDFTALVNHTLTFAGTSGETQSFTITPTADTKLEANEILTVTQSNLSATSLPVEISDIATITIVNNDSAAVTIADISGNEDDGDITITATLDFAVQGGFTVDLSTLDGTATTDDSDYSSVIDHTLTFAGIEGETQTFTVSPLADTEVESDETIMVNQSNLAATTLSVVITDSATITINNDDMPSVTIADISGNEDDGAITVTAALDFAVQGGFTVDLSTSDGTATTADSDYTSVTDQTLTFLGIEGETQTFTVTPSVDAKLEADETITISQSNLAATTLSVIITDEATVTITNDDISTVTIADISGNEDDGAITVTATLDFAVQGGFTVDVSTIDGTATTDDADYDAIVNETLTFVGNEGETQTFTVSPLADTKVESNETIMVGQSNLAATTLSVVITDSATITINNDDATTGVSFIEENKMSVYPNPCADIINIHNCSEGSLIIISDLSGKTLLKKDYNDETEINISHLTSGVYLLTNINSNGEKQLIKIVKE